MIFGIGLDVVDIKAFGEQLDDQASSFVEGTFTLGEQQYAKQASDSSFVRHLAVRFAAKEALIKAWSATHWGKSPLLSHVDMREIEVVLDQFGRPMLLLHGDVADIIEQLGSLNIHVSLSHDGGYAAAFVMLEKNEGLVE